MPALAVPVLLLCAILALLCRSVQRAFELPLRQHPALLFVVPIVLSTVFWATTAGLGAFSAPLAALVLLYNLAPTVCAYLIRDKPAPSGIDFIIILLLWLPLELAVGREWVPAQVQGTLHAVAYGISILLGLAIFLLFRRLDGMKYNLPRSRRDFLNLAAGFAACALVLIPLGRAIGFMGPFHLPVHQTFAGAGIEFLVILAATALPEEILFRGLIQNSLMQRLGGKFGVLALSAVIFGCAHLNNGPGPLPNWRYAIVATCAGLAYGWVFQKSSSVLASTGLHALVNTVKHLGF